MIEIDAKETNSEEEGKENKEGGSLSHSLSDQATNLLDEQRMRRLHASTEELPDSPDTTAAAISAAVDSETNTIAAVDSDTNPIAAVDSETNTIAAVDSETNTIAAVESETNPIAAVESETNPIAAVDLIE